MKHLLLILLLLNLFACSPERRLARLIANNPELIKHDTIFRQDTTIVNGVIHDTIFRTQITKDTIIIKDHQLTIKYYNDGKTTYIKGVCDTVFVIKKIPVEVNSVNPVEVKIQYYEHWWMKFLIGWFVISFPAFLLFLWIKIKS